MNDLEVSKIEKFEELMRTLPNTSEHNEKYELGLGCKYEHEFVNGIYLRKMFLPEDRYFVTAVHLTEHPFFVMYGDVDVYQDGVINNIKGPYQGITKPGTKRALKTNKDTMWITIHVTNKTDVEAIGKDIVVDTYKEYKLLLESKGVV